ncbi:uncharacterized protein LOC119054309 [Artibeus jamaicensis]|uniref:uncharacterized protein LOC119054309 n=1 Tax=Artibeus jamaicensis TaxID=9417 RepID=UPI00235AD609|nr:uncharacterized protein LOC119054309 [Artibeus jamaicensis]
MQATRAWARLARPPPLALCAKQPAPATVLPAHSGACLPPGPQGAPPSSRAHIPSSLQSRGCPSHEAKGRDAVRGTPTIPETSSEQALDSSSLVQTQLDSRSPGSLAFFTISVQQDFGGFALKHPESPWQQPLQAPRCEGHRLALLHGCVDLRLLRSRFCVPTSAVHTGLPGNPWGTYLAHTGQVSRCSGVDGSRDSVTNRNHSHFRITPQTTQIFQNTTSAQLLTNAKLGCSRMSLSAFLQPPFWMREPRPFFSGTSFSLPLLPPRTFRSASLSEGEFWAPPS